LQIFTPESVLVLKVVVLDAEFAANFPYVCITIVLTMEVHRSIEHSKKQKWYMLATSESSTIAFLQVAIQFVSKQSVFSFSF
jgi:hypothetical protein